MNNSETGEKQSTPKHTIETADFLGLSDQSFVEFCPTNSSSPQRQWRQNYRNRRSWNRQNHGYYGNYHSHSYSGTADKSHNRTFHGPYENYQHRFSFNRSFSSYLSTPPKNDPGSPKHISGRGNYIQSYLHPSFMEDPWKVLEKERMNSGNLDIDSEELKESSTDSTEEV